MCLISTRKNELVDNISMIDAVGTVVIGYISNHKIAVGDLPSLIGVVANALATACNSPIKIDDRPVLPMPIRRSITPDALISFENGRGYRTLTKHLATRGMTPEAYREKWGLPASYPMSAPNYSAIRSAMAKSRGFGRKKAEATPNPEPPPAKRGRGRPRRSVP